MSVGATLASSYRRHLIRFFTFIGGLYFFLEFVLPKEVKGLEFGKFHQQISTGVVVVGAMAIGLGIINLVRVHGGAIIRRKKGWLNSVALLVGMTVVFSIEIIDFSTTEMKAAELREISSLEIFTERIHKEHHPGNAAQSVVRMEAMVKSLDRIGEHFRSGDGFVRSQESTKAGRAASAEFSSRLKETKEKARLLHNVYQNDSHESVIAETMSSFIASLKALGATARDLAEMNYQSTAVKKSSRFVFEAFFVPLGSAMFSLLAFYVVTAAYRTFRVRSVEAALMMCAATVVMLGQIPFGPYLWEGFPDIRLWLLKYISTPSFRAIFFGATIAALAMAIRMWLSLDKSPLDASDVVTDIASGGEKA